jgi:hypothetical protein
LLALLGALWVSGASSEGDIHTLSEWPDFLEQAGLIHATVVDQTEEEIIKAFKR